MTMGCHMRYIIHYMSYDVWHTLLPTCEGLSKAPSRIQTHKSHKIKASPDPSKVDDHGMSYEVYRILHVI